MADAYTAPKTYAFEELHTSDDHNTYERDNVTALYNTLVGDAGAALVHRHLSGTLASRPAAGNAGRAYIATDAGEQRAFFDDGSVWLEVPLLETTAAGAHVAVLFQANPQSVNNDTLTTLDFASATTQLDTSSMVNTANDRLDVPADGQYLITVEAEFASDADGYRFLTSTPSNHSVRVPSAGSSDPTILSLAGVGELQAASAVQFKVQHTAGAALNILSWKASLALLTRRTS